MSDNSTSKTSTSKSDQDTSNDQLSSKQTQDTTVETPELSPITLSELSTVEVGPTHYIISLNLEFTIAMVSAKTGLSEVEATKTIDLLMPLWLARHFNGVLFDDAFYDYCGLTEETKKKYQEHEQTVLEYISGAMVTRLEEANRKNLKLKFIGYGKYANVGKLMVLKPEDYDKLRETKRDVLKRFLGETLGLGESDRYITFSVVS